MSKYGADMSDGTAIRQQRGGHCVTEHVGVHPLFQPGAQRVAVKAFPGALGSQPYGWITLRDKNGRMGIVTELEIPMQPLQYRVREIYGPLLVALADDPCLACLPINLLAIQGQRLRDAHATCT